MGMYIKESAPNFYCRLDEDTYNAIVEKVLVTQEQAFGKEDGELEDRINFVLKIEDAVFEGKTIEEAKSYLTYKTSTKLTRDPRCKLGLIMSKLGLYGPDDKGVDPEDAIGKKLRISVGDKANEAGTKINTTITALMAVKTVDVKKPGLVQPVAKKASKPVVTKPTQPVAEADDLEQAMTDVVDNELDDLLNL